MDTKQWGTLWNWAKANGIAAFLGAATVKLWDWGLKRWKRRLRPMERIILVLAEENCGSLAWKDNTEVGSILIGYKVLYFKKTGNLIEPATLHEEFAEEGEVGALISKGYMEISNSGYHRRLTPDGFWKARKLRANFEKKGILPLTRLPGEALDEIRKDLSLLRWWDTWEKHLSARFLRTPPDAP